MADLREVRCSTDGERAGNETQFAGHSLSTMDGKGVRRFVANRNQGLGGRSWVYFAQRGEGGPIKIGRTRRLSERVYALQSVCPEEVTLLGKLPETDLPEKTVHYAFHRHLIRGEWFRPAPEIIALAEAGMRIYAAGFTDEVHESRTDDWLLIRSYRR